MSLHHPTPLKFLMPGWFAIVMGLCGLSLAWFRAQAVMGLGALTVAWALGAAAALVFVVLLVLSLVRLQRHAQALQEDLRHPVRQAFVSTVPASVILLSTVATSLVGPLPGVVACWMVGSAAQGMVTVWVLSRWLRPAKADGFAWPAITPVLLIAIVGNVVPALAGPALGYPEWAAAQFGVGVLFWPVVLVLLGVRIGTQGLWSERLLPTTFITIAPPAVLGLGVLAFRGPTLLAWMCWGTGLFFLAWSSVVFKRMVSQPFAMAFWALSFPLAALSALTLSLLTPGNSLFAAVAMGMLALTTLVVAWLGLSTLKGLRDGSLLVPEPVAVLHPV